MDRWQRDRFWEEFTDYMGGFHPAYVPRGSANGSRLVVPPTWHADAARIAAGINWLSDENTLQVDLTLNVKGDKPLTLKWYKQLIGEMGLKDQLVTATADLWKPDRRPNDAESWIVVKTRALPEEDWVKHYA